MLQIQLRQLHRARTGIRTRTVDIPPVFPFVALAVAMSILLTATENHWTPSALPWGIAGCEAFLPLPISHIGAGAGARRSANSCSGVFRSNNGFLGKTKMATSEEENTNINSNSFDRGALLDERLGLVDRFDRWRFLQRLLDGEVNPTDTAGVLMALLEEKFDTRRQPKALLPNGSEENMEDNSTVLTAERFTAVERFLSNDRNLRGVQQFLTTGSESEKMSDDNEATGIVVTATATTTTPSASLLMDLETLLPDPIDDEDASKGLWDIVIELNGRESVKINERDGRFAWKLRCMIARILLYYDFLSKGR